MYCYSASLSLKAGVHYTTFVASGVVPTANSHRAYAHTIRLRARNISAHITQQKLVVTCGNDRVLSGFVESKCAYCAPSSCEWILFVR